MAGQDITDSDLLKRTFEGRGRDPGLQESFLVRRCDMTGRRRFLPVDCPRPSSVVPPRLSTLGANRFRAGAVRGVMRMSS